MLFWSFDTLGLLLLWFGLYDMNMITMYQLLLKLLILEWDMVVIFTYLSGIYRQIFREWHLFSQYLNCKFNSWLWGLNQVLQPLKKWKISWFSLLETRARASFDMDKLLVLTNLSAFTFCDAPCRKSGPWRVFLSLPFLLLFLCACVDDKTECLSQTQRFKHFFT